MTELNVKYPATTPPPEPSGPGKVIHTYLDVTPHQGEEVHDRFLRASTEMERYAVLHDMPHATVTFHELEEGEPFFDDVDMPKDKNGFALWNTVWVKEIGDIGAIDAIHGDEYDVMTGGDLLRLKHDQIKHLADLTPEEDEQLQRLAAKDRAER